MEELEPFAGGGWHAVGTDTAAKQQCKSPCPVAPGAQQNSYIIAARHVSVSLRGRPRTSAGGAGGRERGDAARRGEREGGRNGGVVERTELAERKNKGLR